MNRAMHQKSTFSKSKRFLVIAFLGLLIGHNSVSADSSEWLMKINQASANTNFFGSFVYIHDGLVEAMQVARRIDGGVLQERLFSLNGEPREVIRDMNQVWCYIPDQNVVVHDYRQVSGGGFPRILPGNIERLSQFYRFEEGDISRIANRTAQQIKVIPKDSYRYGYSLWADQETGLLLRSDLVDMNDAIIEQYLFIDVEVGGVITDEQLSAVSATDDLQLFGNNTPLSTPAESSKWVVRNIPKGFSLSKHIRRISPMDSGEVEHMVFTDGLSTVSVFIKKVNEGQSDMTGLSRMGAVHAFRTTLNNHRITVMGEVPADTVKFLAMGVGVSE
jgi:sigma-E factor negative regulatory protein RseB